MEDAPRRVRFPAVHHPSPVRFVGRPCTCLERDARMVITQRRAYLDTHTHVHRPAFVSSPSFSSFVFLSSRFHCFPSASAICPQPFQSPKLLTVAWPDGLTGTHCCRNMCGCFGRMLQAHLVGSDMCKHKRAPSLEAREGTHTHTHIERTPRLFWLKCETFWLRPRLSSRGLAPLHSKVSVRALLGVAAIVEHPHRRPPLPPFLSGGREPQSAPARRG